MTINTSDFTFFNKENVNSQTNRKSSNSLRQKHKNKIIPVYPFREEAGRPYVSGTTYACSHQAALFTATTTARIKEKTVTYSIQRNSRTTSSYSALSPAFIRSKYELIYQQLKRPFS